MNQSVHLLSGPLCQPLTTWFPFNKSKTANWASKRENLARGHIHETVLGSISTNIESNYVKLSNILRRSIRSAEA